MKRLLMELSDILPILIGMGFGLAVARLESRGYSRAATAVLGAFVVMLIVGGIVVWYWR